MQYSYIKSGSLSVEQKNRLRILIGTNLRLNGIVRHPSRKHLVKELLALFTEFDESVINPRAPRWLLSYGNPKILIRLIELLADAHPRDTILRILAQADCAHLLPREYISPDFQKVQMTQNPKTALICFTGNTHRLSMPVHAFHCLVAKHFGMIFYLRDFEKQHFTQGIPGIAGSLPELSKELRKQIPMDCHITVLSTSSGGYAAARFAEEVAVDRLALFSPPLMFKGVAAVNSVKTMNPDNARLFFASRHAVDKQLAHQWGGTAYAPSIRLLNSDSHGTLYTVLDEGYFDDLLAWLLGGANLILGEQYSIPERIF